MSGVQGGSSPSLLALSHSFATLSISITSPMKLLNGRGPKRVTSLGQLSFQNEKTGFLAGEGILYLFLCP